MRSQIRMEELYFIAILAAAIALTAIAVSKRENSGLAIISGILFIFLGLSTMLSPVSSTSYAINTTRVANNVTTYAYTTQTTPALSSDNFQYLFSVIFIFLGLAIALGTFAVNRANGRAA